MASPGLNRLFLPCSKSPSCSPCCTRASSSPKQTTGETSTRPRTAAGKAGSQHFPSPRPLPLLQPHQSKTSEDRRHQGRDTRERLIPWDWRFSLQGMAPLLWSWLPVVSSCSLPPSWGTFGRSLHIHLSSSVAMNHHPLPRTLMVLGVQEHRGAQLCRQQHKDECSPGSGHFLSACQREFGTPDPVPGGKGVRNCSRAGNTEISQLCAKDIPKLHGVPIK